ncbi:expressed unknown protein [Ectocarpus siliculosus]|uniref:Uncharacterized protein n=1 Tax=Ectocarpus siliculosus TaxID=2880 RepID=D7FZA7_ECTSI|nr:expressed unknown protein [Ectocarpus siliculosus]|eukprot:CBJ32724.1 expressed unknown protein [Ectocarpus siliculosus]
MLLVEYVALLGAGTGSSTHPWPTTQPLPEAAAAPLSLRLLRDSFSNDGDERTGEDEGEREVGESQTVANSSRRLAIVVPIQVADLRKAQASLAAWPTRCHSSTLVNTDLVAYYAGGDDEHVAAMLATIEQTGGRCFARTRLVLAHASDKDNERPEIASIQFYKLYLDSTIRRQFADYDAFAVMEWNVIVAHDRSFEELYTAAFGGVEPFWVKGSALVSGSSHETVVRPENRTTVGHINGNAIYNNTDQTFVDYVNFTATRWEYTLPYDEALWATISDFPYSWPLWQRFSRKFVTTNLIANVGVHDVDDREVLDAVAGGTLFIHGTPTDGGVSMAGSNELAERCTVSCGFRFPNAHAAMAPSGTATVCDRSCYAGGRDGARFGGHLCGAGDVAIYAINARRWTTRCTTFEPPTEDEDWESPVEAEQARAMVKLGEEADADAQEKAPQTSMSAPLPHSFNTDSLTLTDEATSSNPTNEPFVTGIKRGQICAFLTSNAFVIKETQVTVKSIGQFMPGMRVAIATDANDVSLFKRVFGTVPEVRVSEAIRSASRAPLLADRHCGEGTKLILYMKAGELLWRTFTSKDTHSPAGDLLVAYSELDRVGQSRKNKALAAMLVLGFKSPSFSFGTDIILPVDVNRELRNFLLSDPTTVKGKVSTNGDLQAVHALGKVPGIYVPEVLAAFAYSRNAAGLRFINPRQWVTHHMFQKASVWDIPLVKPRFSCVIDISMAAKGYDVAAALEEQLSHFVSGSPCAWGSIHLDPALLRPKAGIEFGYPTGKDMPSISTLNLRVSVVFYSGRSASPTLLDASISSVALRFPEVFEVVVVFTEPPIERAGLEDVLNAYIEEAPFAVEIIEEVDGSRHSLIGSRSRWSGLQADDHSSGQFVMQLEVGDILMSDVTYENLFYFGKPVIPYKRLSPGGDVDSSAGGSRMDQYLACGIETIVDIHEVRDFAVLKGLVYPRAAYSEMRKFVNEVHGVDVDTLAELVHGRCRGTLGKSALGDRPPIRRWILETSLLASFVWRFMPDMVHWSALDPSDIEPDEWLLDVGKYNIWCSLGSLGITEADPRATYVPKELRGVVCDESSYEKLLALQGRGGVQNT